MTTTENNRADALIDERIEDAIYRHIPPKIALENAKALYAMAVELLVASPVEQFAPSPLTERDYDLHEHEQGLYRKFDVRRVDGSSEPGGKHHDCEYFVLDMTHDQHARAALRAYADACASTHPELSADLIARYALAPIEQPAAAPADLQGLRRSILTSREIVRDQDGMLSHPAVPYLDEDVNYETFFAAFGIEATFIHMEDDVDCDTYDRYFASNSPDCCTWTPSSPQGDGWMLLEIYDTEDGPVALYVREKKPESMRERWKREKRESDAAAPSPADERAAFDILAHLQRQREFSEHTFGPGARTAGICDHIRKELKEIEADPGDLTEWIDVVILAFDGAWRAGGSPQQIIDAIVAKQTKNEGRTWPDWRTVPADKAIEHDRSQDACQQCHGKGTVVFRDPEGKPFDMSAFVGTTFYTAPQPAQPAAAPIDELTQAAFDERAVDRFVEAMKAKLADARAKGRRGWQHCEPQDLSRMLREHVEKGDPRDVANFCAFLWNMGESIAAPAPSPAEERAASWYCCDPVQICSAQCDSCAKQVRAALTAIVDERAECIAWANANGFTKYHGSLCAAWEERARRAAQQLSTEIAELKIKLVSYESEREDQTRYLAAQSEEIADLKQQLAHADARGGLTATVIQKCIDSCAAEYLEDVTGHPEDAAYCQGITDCIDALNRLKTADWSAILAAHSGQSEPETATVARIEQLRKALFESRDAMRVMSNWAKKPDPAGHSWAVRMVDRANAALNGEPEPRAEVTGGDELKARRLIRYGECRCILTQYCDGMCNPIYEDDARSGASTSALDAYKVAPVTLLEQQKRSIAERHFQGAPDVCRALKCIDEACAEMLTTARTGASS